MLGRCTYAAIFLREKYWFYGQLKKLCNVKESTDKPASHHDGNCFVSSMSPKKRVDKCEERMTKSECIQVGFQPSAVQMELCFCNSSHRTVLWARPSKECSSGSWHVSILPHIYVYMLTSWKHMNQSHTRKRFLVNGFTDLTIFLEYCWKACLFPFVDCSAHYRHPSEVQFFKF